MRVARILAVLAVPLLVLSSCTSAGVAGPSSTGSAGSPAAVVPTAPSSVVDPVAPGATSSRGASSGTTGGAATRPPAPDAAAVPPKPALPTVDPLTGGRPNGSPVIAVKIDNTYFAVAQFGVADADVVFVEQVEGGLTRLIAVFHTTLSSEVGPVRSVRSTDAQLLPAFGRPALVFAGGAGGPLAALHATSVLDTSGMTAAYFRSPAAYGTYNLHADLTKIAAAATGLPPARFMGFTFAATSPLVGAGRPVAAIHLVMQAGGIDFRYQNGHFVRTRGGDEVHDYQGRPEQADNVLVQNVLDEPDGTVDSVGSPSYLSKTVGSGTVTLFRDGRAIPGTWKRAAATDPFTYADAAGRPLPFKPGKTWVALAPHSAQLTLG